MSDDTIYSNKQIKIYLSERRLYFFNQQTQTRVYPVAIGKPATPTPTGTYRIINKVVNPGGILGTRWMGLDIPNGPYGIHGTFQPDSIGKAVSNGCIRLYNNDIEELFSFVKVGTTVIIQSFSADDQMGGLGGYKNYIVKPGDTLWKIAQQFGVTVEQLMSLNNISNPDNLQVGQILLIP